MECCENLCFTNRLHLKLLFGLKNQAIGSTVEETLYADLVQNAVLLGVILELASRMLHFRDRLC